MPPINTALELKYFKKKSETEEEGSKIYHQWPEKGKIIFENFSVKYRKNLKKVLKKINLEISPGEKVGIIGRTGAGKSTINNAILRILEAYEGRILIDEIDISNLPLDILRSRITSILQVKVKCFI